MIGIAFIGKPKTIEEAQKILDENVTVDDFISSMKGEEKELYDKLSDEDKAKYKDLSFTITSVSEKDGFTEFRNGLDEQVIAIFTTPQE
jgi:hypothetical protein